MCQPLKFFERPHPGSDFRGVFPNHLPAVPPADLAVNIA